MKDGEQRLVVKRALAKDGVAHIRKMSDYYEKNKDHYPLHPEARALLEKLLHMLAEEGEDATFSYIRREVDWKHSPKH